MHKIYALSLPPALSLSLTLSPSLPLSLSLSLSIFLPLSLSLFESQSTKSLHDRGAPLPPHSLHGRYCRALTSAAWQGIRVYVRMRVYVCVCAREREKEIDRVCVCVCGHVQRCLFTQEKFHVFKSTRIWMTIWD